MPPASRCLGVGMIGYPSTDVIRVVLRLAEQGCHVVIVGLIANDVATAAETHQSAVAQQAKLMGYGRFRDADETRDIADAEWRLAEGVEYPDASRIGEGLEHLGHVADQIVGGGLGSRGCQSLGVYRVALGCARHFFRGIYLNICSDSTITEAAEQDRSRSQTSNRSALEPSTVTQESALPHAGMNEYLSSSQWK